MILETAAIIGMYLWLTEDDGLLRKPFAWCASRVKNKYLNKALFECLHCRAFWATVLFMSLHFNINYLLDVPLVWILSITGYRLIN